MKRKSVLNLALGLAVLLVFASEVSAEVTFDSATVAIGQPGSLDQEGTHFALTDGDNPDLVVDSAEPIRLSLQTTAEIVVMNIEPKPGNAATSLTLSGLVPNTTYYKYEDDLHNLAVFTSDENGQFRYVQDISTHHMVSILRRHSTLFIRNDATGGDCTRIGTWNAATTTCTMTSDQSETIQIDSDGIILDGNGHALKGAGPNVVAFGVYISGKWNVQVKNLTIQGFYFGLVTTNAVQNGLFTNITFFNNRFGAEITYSYCSTVAYSTAYNNYIGLFSTGSTWRTNLTSNHVYNNTVGIQLQGLGHHVIEDNVSENNTYGFYVAVSADTLAGNTFRNNSYGGRIDTTGNLLYNNNFVGNTTKDIDPWASNNTFNLQAPYGGNYWDRYDSAAEGCSDANGDGFCDQPYSPSTSVTDALPYLMANGWGPSHLSPEKCGLSLNNSPKANAGPDQTIQCGQTVTLDGSGSSDPDGDTLSYTWSGPFGTVSGVRPEVSLPLGANSITLQVSDGKGGTATDTVMITMVDSMAPSTAASVSGTAGTNGWYRSPVSVNLSATDICSGVSGITTIVNGTTKIIPGANATVSFTEGRNTFSYFATDNAGIREGTKDLPINVDQTPPTITASFSSTPNASGWLNKDVTVTFTCSDALSGIASCPDPITVSSEGAGQVIRGTAIDKAGNRASISVTVNIDKTAPVVQVSVSQDILWPPNHKIINVTVGGNAFDSGSGVSSTVFTVVDEYGIVQPTVSGFNTAIPLEAWREGTDRDGRVYTIIAVVTDKAGNQSTATTTVVVPHDLR